MSGGLLRKEWREHRAAWLLFYLLFGGLIGLVSLAGDRYATRGNIFELLKMPTAVLATAGALYMGHRLIVREYGQRTQLFLEALPLSRPRILATKLVLGAAVLLLPLALTLAVISRMAAQSEEVTSRFLLILGLRSATVVLLGWAFFLLAGLVGRYRNPLYIFLLVCAFAVDQLTDVNLSTAGPIALLGNDFPFERQNIPWEDLRACWALIAVATAMSFGLVLYRDGTIAELLSQRMSHREKVFIACVLTGMVIVIGMLDDAKERKPFALHESEQSGVGSSTVQVASGVGFSQDAARMMAERLAGDLGALSGYLGLTRLPTVAVMPIRELDADVFQRAKLEKADGVVVRANLAAPDFDVRAFEAFLFREVLIWASEGVVLREERQWLLDGFTTWWAHRDGEAARLAPRAAVASREDFDASHWLSARERLGPCLSGALASRGVQVLHAKLGDAAFQALMRRVLAHTPGTGFWGLLREPRLGSLLREQGSLTEDELSRLWRESLRQEREAHAAVLQPLARLSPALSLVEESEETFRLEHGLRASEEQGLPARYALLYSKLEPFANEVPADALSRQDARTSAGEARLPRTLARGERWLFVMQVESEALGCPVRLLAERREIP